MPIDGGPDRGRPLGVPEGPDGSSLTRRDFFARTSMAAGALALSPLLRGADADAVGPAVADPEVRAFGPGLDRFIRSKMRAAHLPSLTAATVRGERITWAKGYGLADDKAHLEADPDTVYMLASISKTFICAALMQLWEAGSVDLDADVNTYLPFPVRNPKHPNSKITARMLLTHTSSIADRYSVWGTLADPTPYGYCRGDATIALGTWLADYLVSGGAYYVADKNFYATRPGKRYHYSNIGADVAAYMVEAVSGQPFGDYCRDHLFTPLGMSQTGYHLSDITTPNLAMPYRYEHGSGRYKAYFQYGYPDYPCGCLRTSANSLSIWLRCFMNHGTCEGVQILKPSTVREIFRPQIPGNWWQGLIWYYDSRGGDVLIGHNGGDYGVNTGMYFAPKRDVGVVTLSNRYVGGWYAWYRYLDIQDRLFDLV